MYDPVRDRMLVYASPVGEQVPGSEGVWAVALGDPPAWTHVTTAGAPPPGSYGASVLYDPVRDRMLVFIMTSLPSTETWQLSLAGTPTWSRIDFAGTVPSPRRSCPGAHDASRDRARL